MGNKLMQTRGLDSSPFDVDTIMSPALEDGEPKDQDRAAWFPAVGVAALADGVTTSPYSQRAADILVEFAPILFRGDMTERLAGLSDLLFTFRLNTRFEPLKSSATLPSLQKLIENAARTKLAQAYQSTLVGACFTPVDSGICAEIVSCGDSMFAAFDPAGQPIMITPADTQTDSEPAGDINEFGPGDNYLVKVVDNADGHEEICRTAHINTANAGNWYICRPVELCNRSGGKPSSYDNRARRVGKDTVILATKHLLGKIVDPIQPEYRVLRYSDTIRVVPASGPPQQYLIYKNKSAVTAVLPDHYAAGRWEHWKENFPAATHFLLASDGFYSAFENPHQMGRWLLDHSADLGMNAQKTPLLDELHAQLHGSVGDDDISFVWIRPAAGNDD